MGAKAQRPIFQSPGEMARRIRAHDWAGTPLGLTSEWPQSLLTLVDLMLSSAQPMFLAWGPEWTWLYNDAVIPILGRKHPTALGRPALDEVWSEADDVLRPLFDQVKRGEPVQMDDFSLLLDRFGRPELAHFAFSYTPARNELGVVAGLFGACTETTELVVGRVRSEAAESALSETAEAARLAAERVDLALRAGSIIGTWVWDITADRFLSDEQFAVAMGLDAELFRTGLPMARVMESIHADDKARVASDIEQALAQGGAYRCRYRVLRSDGQYRWAEASGEVELDAQGRAVRFPGVLVDIDEHRRVEMALVESNNLLRTFLEAVPGVVYAKNRQGQLLVGNRGTAELLGRPYEEFVGRTDMELLDDKTEAAAIMANDQRVMESRTAQILDEPVAYPDGTRAWWHSTKAPLFNEAGEVIGLIGSSVDITERRKAEEHRALLLNELNHRVKNTLAVVQSIAWQTFRHATDTQSASDSFEKRLTALSRAHGLLTNADWSSADLRDIASGQLGEIGPRARLDGPTVLLPPQVAVSVALALHELGTNAMKYGALSNDSGTVQISWTIDDLRWLSLRWDESGGPPVTPPSRRGFGSRLIERALALELGGKVNVEYRPSGLVCEIRAPLPN